MSYKVSVEYKGSFYRLPECENPFYIKKWHMYVPCGHCPLCLLKQKKEWITRLNCQYRTSRTGCFITLTFDVEHKSNTSYEKVQRFIRRYKHCFKIKPKQLVYFGCFEKGDMTNREHYHILLFGHNPINIYKNYFKTNEVVAKIWRNGLVKVEALNEKSIKYVCQYVSKKFNSNNYSKFLTAVRSINKFSRNDIEFMLSARQVDVIKEERETFLFMSKGLGFDYFFKHQKKILEDNLIRFGNKFYSIPKAFLTKLKRISGFFLDYSPFFFARREHFRLEPELYSNIIHPIIDETEWNYIQNGIYEVCKEKALIKLNSLNDKFRMVQAIKSARERTVHIPF